MSDVLGLLVAWGVSFLVRRPATHRYTYGFRRSSILAALFNASFLLLVMGGIAWEAMQRLTHPDPVIGQVMIGVALVGVLINTITALMFSSGRDRDLNLRGVFLHMAADALVSLGVVIAGIVILATGWLWVDPAMSLIIVAIVALNTWQLLRDSLDLALDAVPQSIEAIAIRTYLTELPDVAQVHDLHIWGMSTTETAMTAHLVIPTGHPGDAFLEQVSKNLREQFEVHHITLQVEMGDPHHPCMLGSKHSCLEVDS